MSESPTGRTRPRAPELQRLPAPLSVEGERLRAAMIDAFPECAWWHERMRHAMTRVTTHNLNYGRIERRLLLHANEYRPRDFFDRLVDDHRSLAPHRILGSSFDFCVMDDLTTPREPVPQTDVQARISAPTLALFLGGCILRDETLT